LTVRIAVAVSQLVAKKTPLPRLNWLERLTSQPLLLKLWVGFIELEKFELSTSSPKPDALSESSVEGAFAADFCIGGTARTVFNGNTAGLLGTALDRR
jgi:hypothetical protein